MCDTVHNIISLLLVRGENTHFDTELDMIISWQLCITTATHSLGKSCRQLI